jgi:hypothetical protein
MATELVTSLGMDTHVAHSHVAATVSGDGDWSAVDLYITSRPVGIGSPVPLP